MIPVAVRLSNSNIDQHITNRISGLWWRSTAPGGFGPAAFSLHSPIDLKDPLLAAFTRAYIYDRRTGETLWEGKLESSGRTADDQGQVWSLTGLGPSAHTLDQTAPLIYIDSTLDNWQRDVLETAFIPAAANASTSTHPGGTVDGILCQFASDTDVTSTGTTTRISAGYYGFVGSGMEIGAFGYGWDAGFTSTNFAVESVVGTSPTYAVITDNPTANIAGGSTSEFVIDNFTGNRDIVAVRLRRVAGGATTLVGDFWWAFFNSIRVLGRRMLKDGTLVSGLTGMGSSSIYVRASWVVADLLGRMLPQYDGVNAIIDATSEVDIDQLAYLDPANPSQVLEDLMKFEPSKFWMAGPSNAAGLYSFEWKIWPTSIRYEATITDGFDSPAPSSELYNRVRVRWMDPRRRIRSTLRTQAIAELDDNGIVREGYVDISDEAGSMTNANQVGDAFLTEHNARTSGGTLTLARPVLDVDESRLVDPWQIKAGELIRIRGVEASMATNPASQQRDGITVFRIVSAQPDGEGRVVLELDMFTRSETRALVDLIKKRSRKR